MTRVDVVDFDVDTEPLNIDEGPDVEGLPSVLYVPVPRWLSPAELDRRANQLDEQWRVFAGLVVCRVHPMQREQFMSHPAVRDDLVARFPDVPVALLSFEQSSFRLDLLSGELDAELQQPLLAALTHAELRAVLDRSGVILPASEDFHYQGPNGWHYESFVRVGTAIQQVDALEAIAFWLLPYLMTSPVIVLDSWTIVSLGLSAAQYLRDNEITGPDGEPARIVAVETRRSYNEPAGRLLQRLVALRERLDGPPPPVLAVVSVSSTGATTQTLRETCERAEFTKIDALALFRSEDREQPQALCVLNEVNQHWPSSVECPYCQQHSQLVRVMPDTFLLELSATVVDDVAITIFSADPARRFLRRYAGSGAVSVHRDQHDGQRHHMIHVDIEALIDHPEFLLRLQDELQDAGDVDLILCPEHDAARALAGVVAEQLNRPLLQADPQALLTLEPDDRTQLEAATRILVVDDVVITGTRLRHYRNMLHRQGVAINEEFELHVLAGVARPADLQRLKGVTDFAHDEDRFHYVEVLPLPNWAKDECPWCDEFQLLLAYGFHAPDDATLAARFSALQNTPAGLRQDLYLPWMADLGELTNPMLLGPGSIFEAKTEPELFAAVASSLQALRNAGRLNERLTLPVAKVLSRHFAFEGRFYDTVITACLLRAARRHDLRASIVDPELEQMAVERLNEHQQFGLHGELLLALRRGQLPGGAAAAGRSNVYEQEGIQVGVRDVLRAALES